MSNKHAMFCVAAVALAIACDKHVVEQTFAANPMCIQLIGRPHATWRFVTLPVPGVEPLTVVPDGVRPMWGTHTTAKLKKELAPDGFTYHLVGTPRTKSAAGEDYVMALQPTCVSGVTTSGGNFTDPASRAFVCEAPEDCRVVAALGRGEFESISLRIRHPDTARDPEIVVGVVEKHAAEKADEVVETDPYARPERPPEQLARWRASSEVKGALRDAVDRVTPEREPDPVHHAQIAVSNAMTVTRAAGHVHALSSGWSKSMLESARRDAKAGQTTVLASSALRLQLDGVEIVRAQIGVGAKCLEDFRRTPNGGRTRIDDAARFDGAKEQPLLIVRDAKLELVWWDDTKNCVVHQNVTAQTLGRPADPTWDFRKELAARMAKPPTSATTLNWRGQKGDFTDEVNWPPPSTKTADAIPSVADAERLLVGPHRAAVHAADGGSLYNLNPASMQNEVCMDNQLSVWPGADGLSHLRAKISAESGCDYDVHGHVHWSEEMATVGDDGTVVLARHVNYDFGSNECGGDRQTTVEFDLGGRVLTWYSTSDELCDHYDYDLAMACGDLVAGCSETWCAVEVPGRAHTRTSSVSLRAGDHVVPLTHATTVTYSSLAPRCGTTPL